MFISIRPAALLYGWLYIYNNIAVIAVINRQLQIENIQAY